LFDSTPKMQATILVLCALVACALAGRGGGGGFKFPQSCKDAHEATKTCIETNVQAKGVNIKVEDVKKCFATCPRGKGEGKGEGKGWGKGDHPKSKDGSSPNEGNWAQFKEVFKAMRECMSGKLGDKMETCVSGKITYAVAAPKESKGDDGPGGPGGPGGWKHGKGGPRGKHGKGDRGGNPLKTLKDKVAKCGAETETCVKAAMGEWYDKIDELSQIMCDASTACPRNADQCKTDLKAGKAAHCACKEQLKPDFEQAKTDCTTDENRDAIERMSQRAGKGKGKGEHKDRCADDDDDDEKERKNPFCDA
jgi:hypothetical protein